MEYPEIIPDNWADEEGSSYLSVEIAKLAAIQERKDMQEFFPIATSKKEDDCISWDEWDEVEITYF